MYLHDVSLVPILDILPSSLATLYVELMTDMEPEDDVILDTYTALRSALPTLPHLTVISIARAPSSRDTSKEVEVWAWHLLKTSLARTRLEEDCATRSIKCRCIVCAFDGDSAY